MAVIRISEAGLSLGVQVDTDLTYHLRANMSVSADGSIVSIFDGEELIASGHTTEFLIPKEESVADLLPKIQELIDTIFIDGVTPDAINAINGANSPSLSNVFTTADDLVGFQRFKGDWDANTNSPVLASGVGIIGDTYRVSVAGATNLDGITDWLVGDKAYFDGTAWQKDDNTDQVSSVFGRVGAVVSMAGDYLASQVTNAFDKLADTSDAITEGATKLFMTVAERTKLGFITVTQAVDLDTMETDIGTNTTNNTGTVAIHSDVSAANATALGNLSGINTGDEVQATETVSGISERATQAETHTGTDDLRHITPLKLESEKGIADGIAELDATGKVPASQLPVGAGALISTVAGIDATVIGDTTLYTAGAGEEVEITALVVRLKAISGGGAVPKVSLGTNAVNYDNIIPSQSTSGLTTVNDAYTFLVQGVNHIAQATEVITLRVSPASARTTYDIDVDLIGQII